MKIDLKGENCLFKFHSLFIEKLDLPISSFFGMSKKEREREKEKGRKRKRNKEKGSRGRATKDGTSGFQSVAPRSLKFVWSLDKFPRAREDQLIHSSEIIE